MSFLGQPVKDDVSRQIEVREKIFSKAEKTNTDLYYQLSKNAWVRMISGVNIGINSTRQSVESQPSTPDSTFNTQTSLNDLAREKAYQDGVRSAAADSTYVKLPDKIRIPKDNSNNEQPPTSPERAKAFILANGVLKWDGSSLKKNQGFFTSLSDQRGTYNYSNEFGIIPEPGITNFNIVTKSTYGTIREANIEFVLFSREDLNEAQTLFLRPGMPVIVEWGNTVYIDNEDETTIVNPNYSNNLTKFFSTDDFNEVNNIIKSTRKESSYNYDGFIGLITNFSFSFESAGSYRCSIKAVSYGAILSTINANTPSKLPPPSTSDEDSVQYKSDFQVYLETIKDFTIYRAPGTRAIKPVTFFTNPGLSEKIRQERDPQYTFVKNIIQGYCAGNLDDKEKAEKNFNILYNATYFRGSSKGPFYYITLRTLLNLMNLSFSSLISTNGKNASNFSLETDYSNYLLTYEDHFSINPNIVLLPKRIKNKTLARGDQGLAPNQREIRDYITVKGYKTVFNNTTYVDINVDLIDNLKEYFRFTSDSPHAFPILELRLNLNYILDKFKNFFSSNSSASAQEFLKNILTDVEKYLGSVNSFDIMFNETTFKYDIVDRNINPLRNYQIALQSSVKPKLINITGTATTVSNLSLVTKITGELASMISISAQAATAVSGQQDISLTKWNEGVYPRYTFKFKDPSNENTLQTLEQNPELTTALQVEVKLNAWSKLKKRYQKWRDSDEVEATEELQELNSVDNVDQVFYNQVARIYSMPSPDNGYTNDEIENIINEFSSRMKAALQITSQSTTETNALIPVELQMTLEGISGLVIGQCFIISDFRSPSVTLPSVYDDYAFIITGLDQKIENDKWYTSIRALTFKYQN